MNISYSQDCDEHCCSYANFSRVNFFSLFVGLVSLILSFFVLELLNIFTVSICKMNLSHSWGCDDHCYSYTNFSSKIFLVYLWM